MLLKKPLLTLETTNSLHYVKEPSPPLEILLKLFIALCQVDEFLIEAVSLKNLDKVRVGHDSTGPGSGWFLDKVVIKDPEDSTKEHVFPCNNS